jgi:hypothetical protein
VLTLQSLSNDDKHRQVGITVTGLAEASLGFTQAGFTDFLPKVFQPMPGWAGPLTVGAKVLRICGEARGENPHVDVEPTG